MVNGAYGILILSGINDRGPNMVAATARACANLAFVKYWGKRDNSLNLPLNNSISMTLDGAHTTTAVAFSAGPGEDRVVLAGQPAPAAFAIRVSRHLDRIRALAGVTAAAHVETVNNFPAGTGLASSASGFAALTLAATAALDLQLTKRELSVLARLGSGSACRSIHDGFVEWHAGDDSDSSCATRLADARHWELVDVAVLVTQQAKAIPSSEGHKLATGSPFWRARRRGLPARLEALREALLTRDFQLFCREVEAEALEMHAIMLTSGHEARGSWQSGIFYWTEDTLRLLIAVQEWRRGGMEVCFTLDAGPTVHLLCLEDQVPDLLQALAGLEGFDDWQLLPSRPGPGAQLLSPG